ncbi:MAG TPA: DinB family protein [Longimicrobiaceae bacterium]|jgi:uncharacterized damage-inducible protein DinB|nr:DinB family protein [Longimicrobiaceae bacterium]
MDSSLFPTSATEGLSPKEQFLRFYRHEHGTTMRVLREYPSEALDLKPAEKSSPAKQLVWTFVLEQWLAERALTTGFDWSSPPPPMPPAPDTVQEIADALDERHGRVVELVQAAADEKMTEPVKWFVGPKTMGDVPLLDFLYGMVHDQIHHRGQLSVYLRIAGAKVPSIYGPSADEPWM